MTKILLSALLTCCMCCAWAAEELAIPDMDSASVVSKMSEPAGSEEALSTLSLAQAQQETSPRTPGASTTPIPKMPYRTDVYDGQSNMLLLFSPDADGMPDTSKDITLWIFGDFSGSNKAHGDLFIRIQEKSPSSKANVDTSNNTDVDYDWVLSIPWDENPPTSIGSASRTVNPKLWGIERQTKFKTRRGSDGKDRPLRYESGGRSGNANRTTTKFNAYAMVIDFKEIQQKIGWTAEKGDVTFYMPGEVGSVTYKRLPDQQSAGEITLLTCYSVDAGTWKENLGMGAHVRIENADINCDAGFAYAWAWARRPSGSNAILINPHTKAPCFTLDKEGHYILWLAAAPSETAPIDAVDTVFISTVPFPSPMPSPTYTFPFGCNESTHALSTR